MRIETLGALFKALEEGKVRYLVTGGLAVVAHGYLRFTADIDLFLDMDRENLRAAMGIFNRLGYRPRAPVDLEEFTDPEKRKRWIQEKGLTVFSLWSPDHPATEIDLFVEEPIPFEKAYSMRMQLKVGEGVEANIIGLDDLISLKKRAGRVQDLQDIDKLKKIRADEDE